MSVEKLNPATTPKLPVIPYTQIYSHVIQHIKDPEAGFVWCYLQSKPTTWSVIKEHLMKHFGFGETKIKKIMAFLNKSKLIKYIRSVDNLGRFGKTLDIQVLSGTEFVIIQKVKRKSTVVCKTARAENQRMEKHTNKDINKDNALNKEKAKKKERAPSVFFTKENFTYSHEERDEAIRRGIDIQKCFNKFAAWKPKFKRKDWEKWFANEKSTVKTTNKHLEEQLNKHQEIKNQEMQGARFGEMGHVGTYNPWRDHEQNH